MKQLIDVHKALINETNSNPVVPSEFASRLTDMQRLALDIVVGPVNNTLKERYGHSKILNTASTGVAADNIGGQTL